LARSSCRVQTRFPTYSPWFSAETRFGERRRAHIPCGRAGNHRERDAICAVHGPTAACARYSGGIRRGRCVRRRGHETGSEVAERSLLQPLISAGGADAPDSRWRLWRPTAPRN
jgi:hypothetical protein